jgi:hypothetical protein
MKTTNYEIKARQTKAGWIEGTINGLKFNAKVFDEGSEFGINEGRVSKLYILDEAQRKIVLNYERGWDVRPKTAADRRTLAALLEYLEALPTLDFWEAIAEGQPTPTTVQMRSGYEAPALMKIDREGWAKIYDAQTGQVYVKLDPIAVRDLLESK